MSIKPRKVLNQVPGYVAAKTIESTKREYHLEQVIKLAGNENTLGYSPKVTDAMVKYFDQLSYYPDMNCTRLREKLAEKHKVKETELIFGNGSFELISIVAQTYLSEGEESIISWPSFGWYKNVTLQQGGEMVIVPLKDYYVDLDAVYHAITEKTKIIWICNPNNPTGTMIKNDDLTEFLEKVPEHIVIVLDEAYADFVEEEDYPDSIRLLKRFTNIIILRTFSKLYGLASFRLGYGIADEQVIEDLNKVRMPINTNALAQVAALASLDDEEFPEKVLKNNKKSLQLYYEELDKLGLHYVKSNCNFILFDTGIDSDWVTEQYVKRGIIVRSGKEFGYPTYLRVSIGKYEENEKVLEILKELKNK